MLKVFMASAYTLHISSSLIDHTFAGPTGGVISLIFHPAASILQCVSVPSLWFSLVFSHLQWVCSLPLPMAFLLPTHQIWLLLSSGEGRVLGNRDALLAWGLQATEVKQNWQL